MEALVVVAALLSVCACPVLADISDALRSYETLHASQLRHRIVRRDVTSASPHIRQVAFTSLGRRFHLHLQRKNSLLSPSFKVVAINANNDHNEVTVEDTHPYEGHVVGEEGTSKVYAIWEDDENLSASIHTGSDVIFIEPSWRHLPKSDNFSMIVYQKSDVIVQQRNEHTGESFCGFVNATEEFGLPPPPDTRGQHRRAERAADFKFVPAHTTCELLLVADYLFYTNMGGGSLSRTTRYLIGLIERVDAIYRGIDFGSGYKGMGFEIKEIRVHEEWTTWDGTDPPHYNIRKDATWGTKALLEAFGHDRTLGGFCLGHLFTYQAFTGGVLGLAYIGSPRTYSLGGICSPDYYKQGARLYLNTGWSSGLNHHNRKLLSQEADLVTTHEFGHNWGSEHDPDTAECSPSSFTGGKYIMYMYSVSGYDANNKVFSPCSRRSVGAVIQQKADICFSVQRKSFCGNMLVETGEECDVGLEGLKGTNPCCDQKCRLKPQAKCSDVNVLCCVNCQLAPSGLLCHEDMDDSPTCDGAAHCTGFSAHCPAPSSKPDGSPCLQRGSCKDGRCMSFCEGLGLTSCICDVVADACKWCCKKSQNSTCQPHTEPALVNSTWLPDGMPCVWGSCDQGVCVKETKELTQRFWSIIENITPDRIGRFMRDNLVGVTIILSLLIWIPISCIIGWQDRKSRQVHAGRLAGENLFHDNQELRVHDARKAYRRCGSYDDYGFKTSAAI